MPRATTRMSRSRLKRSRNKPVGRPRVALAQRKAASFQRVLAEQFRQSPSARKVPRRNRCSPAEFFDRYYFANRPVILRGLMKNWKALRVWSPEYFAAKFGNCLVEIVSGRDRDPHYESNFPNLRTTLRMKDYVRMLNEAGETNNFYLSARNFFFRQRRFQPLLRDVRCPRGLLNPKNFRKGANLFFGPRGTVTSLHHDAQNILFGQIYGRKLFQLIPPCDGDKLYVERECFSAVDLASRDYSRFPLFRRASILSVIVPPGDFLFIPVGWWHWVKALDISMSVSFTDFLVRGGPVAWRFWE
jgi:hypothetical protein